jgi:hypothetical protein
MWIQIGDSLFNLSNFNYVCLAVSGNGHSIVGDTGSDICSTIFHNKDKALVNKVFLDIVTTIENKIDFCKINIDE